MPAKKKGAKTAMPAMPSPPVEGQQMSKFNKYAVVWASVCLLVLPLRASAFVLPVLC